MFQLPLFPLHTVLFPGMPLDLNIFEPRYRLMIQRCLDGDPVFGVNLIRQGEEAYGALAQPCVTGCTARIVSVRKSKADLLLLTVVGEERYRIQQLHPGQPYLVGQVESWPLEHPQTLHMLRGMHNLKLLTLSYIRRIGPLVGEEVDLSLKQLPEEPLRLLYLAATLLQLPPAEKQPLLEAEHANWLFDEVSRLYRRELAVLSRFYPLEEDEAQRAAWLN